MRSLRLVTTVAIALAVTVPAGAGMAQTREEIIKQRADLMHHQFHDWLVVRNYLQGKADQAAVIAAVDGLAKSVPTVPKYFPPGTEGPGPSGKYAPAPEVWTKHDKFLAADKKVGEQVAVLGAAIKSGDQAKAAAAFKELNACNACHHTFQRQVK
jgi:cytochrome c556